ncbi:MAG: YceI family protein [Dermatophilaceae bacterium]
MTSPAAPRPLIDRIPAGTWQVVPHASTARFTVRDKTVATVHGTLPVTAGTAALAPTGVLTHARVELDATAIDTGNSRRETHLATPGLLDTATHPTVVVTAGPSTPGPDGWELAATLSARGTRAPVGLRAVIAGEHAEGIRVHVHGRLDRTPLAMKIPRFIIGRYLDLDVDLLFVPRT